jgi:hypothetical protein
LTADWLPCCPEQHGFATRARGSPVRPEQDFDFGPEEKAWDEEDGLFDSEEIVID